jgi:DNA-binding IscR family transcriptional regulator
VRGAKELVDHARIGGVLLERQKSLIQVLDVVTSLDEEELNDA